MTDEKPASEPKRPARQKRVYTRQSPTQTPAAPKAPAVDVSLQTKRNLRDAFKGQDTIAQAGTHVYLYLNASDGERDNIDKILNSLGLLQIAQRCLINGETLLAAGEDSIYTTPAQRRAWAAGRVQAAITAIAVAKQMVEQISTRNERIAELERKYAYARAETRAAAKFGQIEVPYREPRKNQRTDWLAGERADD